MRFCLVAILLLLAGCGAGTTNSSSRNGTTQSNALSCVEGGKTYVSGETWKCSDGCNSCGCSNGRVTSTLLGCGP